MHRPPPLRKIVKPNEIPVVPGIRLGIRGERFKRFIVDVLSANENRALSPTDVEFLTSEKNIQLYANAFTSSDIDMQNNYEVFEHLGDTTLNKFVADYLFRRFPQLNHPRGVKIATVILNNLISKKSFSNIAESLQFSNYISATNDTFADETKRLSLLEDCFEAFIGTTEHILDQKYGIGYTYNLIYLLLTPIFDAIPISLKYDDVVDPVTRLKETFDAYKEVLKLQKEETKTGVNSVTMQLRAISLNNSFALSAATSTLIGTGAGKTKQEAERTASTHAIQFLKTKGIYRDQPRDYAILDQTNSFIEPEPEITTDRIIEVYRQKQILHDDSQLPDDFKINEQYQTKFQYGNRDYTSTIIGMYCRARNVSGVLACLELNADPAIPDKNGCSIVDLLFIGPIEEKKVKKIFKAITASAALPIQRSIYDFFYKQYSFAKKYRKRLEVVDPKNEI